MAREQANLRSDYDRIERAILYLTDHAAEQPALEEIAAVVGYRYERLIRGFVADLAVDEHFLVRDDPETFRRVL